MPLNPLIALQGQPVQIQGESLIDKYTKLSQLDALRSQQGLRALQMQELQRQLREQQIAQDYLRGGGAYVGGGSGMPRPDMPQQGTPLPPVAGPIAESGGYASTEPMNAAAGQVALPEGQGMPILPEGGVPQQATQPPQRRQLKPLSELAVDFYTKFPSIAPSMIKQFDEAIKTEQSAGKTFAETLEAQAKAQKTMIEAKKQHLELMTSVLNGMSGNPEHFQEGVAALRELNVPDGLIKLIGPTYNEANINKLRMMGADQKTLLEQQSKQADRMLEQQKLSLEGQKHLLEQQREQRIAGEVLPVDTGQETLLVNRYGGGVPATGPGGYGGPGGQGQTLPSAKEHAIMAPARAEMYKEANKIGQGVKGTLDTLDQLEGLYRDGIYGNNRATKIALGYLNETGSAPPGYEKDKLVRTQEFINRAERISLTQLNEQTLTPVTDTDLAIVRRASGNFGSISSKEQMELSFRESRELALRRAKQADELMEQAKSGKIGGYEQATQQRNQNRPPLSQRPQGQLPANPPGQGRQQAVTLSAAEYQRGVAKAKQAGYTQEEYNAFLAQQGIQVPR